jgi:hypothetical protein
MCRVVSRYPSPPYLSFGEKVNLRTSSPKSRAASPCRRRYTWNTYPMSLISISLQKHGPGGVWSALLQTKPARAMRMCACAREGRVHADIAMPHAERS